MVLLKRQNTMSSKKRSEKVMTVKRIEALRRQNDDKLRGSRGCLQLLALLKHALGGWGGLGTHSAGPCIPVSAPGSSQDVEKPSLEFLKNYG